MKSSSCASEGSPSCSAARLSVLCELRHDGFVRQLRKFLDRLGYCLLELLGIREPFVSGRSIVLAADVEIPVLLALEIRVERGAPVVVVPLVRHAVDHLLLV
jgi:hypothetical protein